MDVPPAEHRAARAPSARHTVRLPGFLREDADVGLGDLVGRATSLAGVQPCGGCLRRAAVLNQWLAFSPSPRNGNGRSS